MLIYTIIFINILKNKYQMVNYYELQLRQKIDLLIWGIDGMKEVNDCLREKESNKTNDYIVFSFYANYAKIKVLLGVFNQNFDDKEMIDLERIVN